MDYRSIVDSYKSGRLSEAEVSQCLSNLVSLLDLSSSLSHARETLEVANILLLSLMGHTGSRRGAFLTRFAGVWQMEVLKGYRKNPEISGWTFPGSLPPLKEAYHEENKPAEEESIQELYRILDVQLLIPVTEGERLLAFAGLGSKIDQEKYTHQEIQTAISLARICGGALEHAETRQKLQSLNKQLSLKIYQLNTLFELSKDFHSVWDTEAIFRILGASLIGQLLISRCAVFTKTDGLLQIRFVRGLHFTESDFRWIPEIQPGSLFDASFTPVIPGQLGSSALQSFCIADQVHLIIPMIFSEEVRGIILLGERKNRREFTQEDFDFISTLANLALVADENTRMQQQMMEKQRMERELAIAREIQVGLLPRILPDIEGYQVESLFEPCYSVGGDYFDFLSIPENRFAIAIGDVSGKSTPAALLMAVLQSSLRALASMDISDPERTVQRINKLLCENQTQAGKYVTFFYAVLDPREHRINYVNAGHCYPLVVKRNGHVDRLETGGTVLGFFQDAIYRSGQYGFDPGDIAIFYTDGVSELANAEEEEFGVDRIVETIRKHQQKDISEIKKELIAALQAFQHQQPQGDDITFVLFKRQESG